MKLKMPLSQFTLISFCSSGNFSGRERLISKWMCSVSHVANLSTFVRLFLKLFCSIGIDGFSATHNNATFNKFCCWNMHLSHTYFFISLSLAIAHRPSIGWCKKYFLYPPLGSLWFSNINQIWHFPNVI